MLNPFQKSNLKIAKAKSFAKGNYHDKGEKPDIVSCFESVVGSQKMRRSGRATLTNCPFHQEKKPSFAMYRDTNSAHCFSCGWSGDSYSFLMEKLGFNFVSAKEYAVSRGLFKHI